MNSTGPSNPHLFHIPVMGTGFSIDTPLRVARYGISSVVSLVDDILIEQMREFYCKKHGLEFVEISWREEDSRANRVKSYLELMGDLLAEQVRALQASPFEPGSEITRYFDLLPDSSLKLSYSRMLSVTDPEEKLRQQESLRHQAVPGTIDVNIMTKLDRDRYENGVKLPPESGDAMAALRGYAQSSLSSSIVFSAGMNVRLFGYLAKFDDFFLNEQGVFKKKIILKVSDFRSAKIQGKYLAKKGLWVSEYRIESGLNCGGHAFATDGLLMGPIMEKFKSGISELTASLHQTYNKGLAGTDRDPVGSPPDVRITVQGGIGTVDEQSLLIEHYGFDATGWGTPFLLVPEVTNVDEAHLKKLCEASDQDVYLSDSSPLGVPFWNLRRSASEETRQQAIDRGKPGSQCPKGFLVSNTEFTQVPICRASRIYQKRKLAQLSKNDLPAAELQAGRERVVVKSCICNDLAGVAVIKHGLGSDAKPAICCGPNIVNFSKIASLEEMVGHIYGRLSILTNTNRSHMFISELSLYVDYLENELQKASEGLIDKTTDFFYGFKGNLIDGIEYYRGFAEQFSQGQKERFLKELDSLFKQLESILPEVEVAVAAEGSA